MPISRTISPLVGRIGAGLLTVLMLAALLPVAVSAAGPYTCSPTSGPVEGGTVVTVSGAPNGTFSVATRVVGFDSPASIPPTTVQSDGTGFTFVTGTSTAGLHALTTTDPTDALCNFTSLNAAGSMTLLPTSGPTSGGTSVALTGTGTTWTAGSTVTVGGAAAAVTFTNATHITITTPAHATVGAVDVVVTTPDAFPTTATGAFTYTSTAPTVTSVAPASGPNAGGTAVTITGTGFVTGATVTFGGAAATSVVVVNATTITTVTPAHAAGAVNVVVTNPDLNSGTGVGVYTYAAPTVTGISPSSGTSLGGTGVTITGTGFVSGATVTLGGTAATSVVFVNSTHLTAVTPAHVAGVVNVVVTNPDTSFGTGVGLYTYTGPTVTAVSPSSGTSAGGTHVTITGTGFVSGATVTLGGSSATSVVFVSSTSLTAVTPAHTAGVVNVVVTNPDTSAGTGTGLYTYTGPTVTLVTPSSGTIAGGTAVTITGTGFVSGATVTFGGSAATSVVFVNSTSLTAMTPAHSAGVVNVVVTNPDSSSGTGTGLYTYTGLTVTINQASGQADPTATSPINFTVVFSASATGFATGDVTITGTAGGTKTATVTGSGTTYNVAVTGMTTGGTVIATVPAGVAVNASSQPNVASTSTDNTVTWNPVTASITITTSAPTPPGAHNPVIQWGQGFTLSVQFASNGSGKQVQLQAQRDGVTWNTIATLTMNSSGHASFFYTPVTNLYYRAVFAGTADLAAANSNTVRTVVREIALLRPTNSGATKTINRNTSITFSTTVRPARPELAPARVSFYFYRYSSGAYRLVTKRDVIIDAAGLARTTFKFTTSGKWWVRSQANPTPYNANSVMTLEKYSVR